MVYWFMSRKWLLAIPPLVVIFLLLYGSISGMAYQNPYKDGMLTLAREISWSESSKGFLVDLLGTGIPQKVDILTRKEADFPVGTTVVVSQGEKVLGSFDLDGQWGEVYVAYLRDGKKPELVCVLYGGNAKLVNGFIIIGDMGAGRIGVLLSDEEFPHEEKPAWSVEGRKLLYDFKVPYPNYWGDNAHLPFLSYRREIQWSPEKNKFKVSDAIPTWSLKAESQQLFMEASSQIQDLNLAERAFKDGSVTEAVYLGYGETAPEGFKVDLSGTGKLAEVILIPEQEWGQTVYVFQEGSFPVYLHLSGDSLRCYAAFLKNGERPEQIFLTESVEGFLQDFLIVGDKGNGKIGILFNGLGIDSGAGNTLSVQGRKLTLKYRNSSSALSITKEQEIWWDPAKNAFQVSEPRRVP